MSSEAADMFFQDQLAAGERSERALNDTLRGMLATSDDPDGDMAAIQSNCASALMLCPFVATMASVYFAKWIDDNRDLVREKCPSVSRYVRPEELT